MFTNYPIVDSDMRSSLVWSPDLVHESIHDALIVIDEAYRDYNSRSFKNFSADEHTFFATNGHNNVDVVLIAQNPARVDVVIREMTNIYYFVRKFQLPFMSRPLWFRVLGFLDEESMAISGIRRWPTLQSLFRSGYRWLMRMIRIISARIAMSIRVSPGWTK